MKNTLNKSCISALLCGAVIIATPALAQFNAGVNGAVTGPWPAAASTPPAP